MRRRRVLLGALTLPGLAQGQPRPGPPRIGYLHSNSLASGNASLQVLRAQWARMGFVEGESVLLRAPDGDAARLPALMEDLVAREVRAVITVGASALAAAAGNGRVPVVAIDLETDPIAAGFARSYARPGGMVTGLFIDQPELAAKWIELLLEAAPRLQRLVLLWDRGTGEHQLAAARAKAAAKGLPAEVLEWRSRPSLDDVLAPFAGTPSGVVTLNVPGFSAIVDRFGAAAERHRLPMIVPTRLRGREPGILLSYGVDQRLYFARAMDFVARILAGAAPGELPIEQPSRFDLVLDLRMARALGLEMPLTLLAQADEVIE